ncbi:MAG: UDP-N-acetylglucosamine--N-acetylmuramyl-(pentapeptide) pyrophosphoryl-undecaprenol N-acetylglucosamine transferase [Candidatus Magasanikbacteria bacterium]|nr:UDP-N-acetylglucosamine--N-acetylmuramyl-(pentapeptide) pyrophosphoryl-undecaprenol N-acetylglucosamine transferase [Candidatus Magasanikbacteria bacterium]
MKIILSGGGTLGPVTTLLAIADAYKKRNSQCEFLWIGTKSGPEKRVVETAGIKFFSIKSGKLRRYFSVINIFDLFRISTAFFESVMILKKEKPDLLISAGGFVSVPLHWAAWFLKIPTWIHQQDVMPGLANRLMAKTATKITVALEKSRQYFDIKKTEWIGNPCREIAADINKSREYFNIRDNEPVILAVGGGTGAQKLNQMVLEALPQLSESWHIIHIVGPERSADGDEDATKKYANYKVFRFLNEEMIYALNAADIVFSRAGFATLTELAFLSKAVILMPISDTHQEKNAEPLAKAGAVSLIDERTDDGAVLAKKIKELAQDPVKREAIGKVLHNFLPVAKPDKISEIIDILIKK